LDYSFNGKIAEMYGVDEAVFIHNLYWWIAKNEANGRHYYDGRNWTYNSMEAFTKLFPFWSIKQVRRIIKNLYEAGAIYTGNYNQRTYDRTQWYSLSESTLALYQTGTDNCPNGQMEAPERARTTAQMGAPIPDINSDINTDIKPDKSTGDKSPSPASFQSIVDDFHRICVSYPKVTKLSDARKKAIKARINSGYTQADFTKLFEKAESSIFLKGKNDRNWSADFDWLIKDANMAKVLDGKYDSMREIGTNKKDGYTPSLNITSIEDEALFHTPTL
jgi:hypothetical protein